MFVGDGAGAGAGARAVPPHLAQLSPVVLAVLAKAAMIPAFPRSSSLAAASACRTGWTGWRLMLTYGARIDDRGHELMIGGANL